MCDRHCEYLAQENNMLGIFRDASCSLYPLRGRYRLGVSSYFRVAGTTGGRPRPGPWVGYFKHVKFDFEILEAGCKSFHDRTTNTTQRTNFKRVHSQKFSRTVSEMKNATRKLVT